MLDMLQAFVRVAKLTGVAGEADREPSIAIDSVMGESMYSISSIRPVPNVLLLDILGRFRDGACKSCGLWELKGTAE